MAGDDKKHTMNMIPVDSSQIAAIGHNPETSELHVHFKSGGRYSYAGVGAEKFQRFLNAESQGQFLGAQIKGKHEFKKLN